MRCLADFKPNNPPCALPRRKVVAVISILAGMTITGNLRLVGFKFFEQAIRRGGLRWGIVFGVYIFGYHLASDQNLNQYLPYIFA